MSDRVKEMVDIVLKSLSLISIAFYIAGFLIWNTFLLRLKFNEIEILQSRFIYTGFFFVLYLFLIYKFIFVLSKYILPISVRWEVEMRDDFMKKYVPRMIGVILISLFVYSIFIFPRLPRVFGGGRPLTMGIIPNESSLMLDNLKDLGMPTASGSKFLTAQACVVYENSNVLIVLTQDRVVQLLKSQLNGVVTLPGQPEVEAFERETCSTLAALWVRPSLVP